MQAELKKNPKTRFYLATDEPPLRAYFQKRFPKRILFGDGAHGRDSLEGMYEAVVELYALAHTRKIIGSHTSSFSYEAAWLKGIPLQIAL